MNTHRLAFLEHEFPFRFINHYQKNTNSLLNKLCQQYGSDKGSIQETNHPYPWPAHTYADYYSRIFDHCRHYIKNVFECGLGTNNPLNVSNMGINGKPGASLRAWRDYFPNATIIGADIDKNILFKDERICTYFVDQTNPSAIKELWNNVEFSFDFMIDDGLHTFEAGLTLFENSIHKLAKEGIYAIEDVSLHDLLKFKQYFDGLKFQVDYINLLRPNTTLGDNTLIVIRHV